MLSPDAKPEWLTLLAIGAILTVTAALLWWPAAIIIALLAAAAILFYRDPDRRIPTARHAMVAPADGRISSIHRVEHYAPFNQPATCIRIFLSVLDVHVNRCPCHCRVAEITHTAGKHGNALNPQSAEDNESRLLLLEHPIRDQPLAAVRLVAGLIARTIHTSVEPARILQRGQRIGVIKLGSTAELYIPDDLKPEVKVVQGEKVRAAETILVAYTPREVEATDSAEPSEPTEAKADTPAQPPAESEAEAEVSADTPDAKPTVEPVTKTGPLFEHPLSPSAKKKTSEAS
ncbi:MAG: phosphatidylserine decarboxylase [Planctomycetota bacterium]